MGAKRITTAIATAGATLAAGLIPAACGDDAASRATTTPILQPSPAQLEAAGLGELPVAPERRRVDLVAPPFSDPTEITNPLFPISELRSAILNGRVDGKPFHTETTLLPGTRTIEWPDGRPVETLVSQYAAFLDGRLEEVALDYYAQAEDGSVWYFGEDVFNYDPDGVIADTDGTWLAGREGSAAMIMPSEPRVGDVHRPENIPGNVFEEVAVKAAGKTVPGPTGPVEGAIVGRELHDDGSFSDKQFAPGYGEFFSAHEGDIEALALAVPTDALAAPPPARLVELEQTGQAVSDLVRAERWTAAGAGAERAAAAWDGLRSEQLPSRLVAPLDRALAALAAQTSDRDPAAGAAAIDVAQAALDLELRHLPPAEVDRRRFGLWAHQLALDAESGALGAARGDLATLEWVRDRFAATLEAVELTRIDARLLALRDAIVDRDLDAVAAEARRLEAP